MDRFSFLNTVHTGFIEDLYQQYLKNPDAVEPSWKSFFQGYDLANSDYTLEPDKVDVEIPQQVYKEFKVIQWLPNQGAFVYKNEPGEKPEILQSDP